MPLLVLSADRPHELVDMIATDHAPHSAEEKSKGLLGSAFGIVGLETVFPLLYTNLVSYLVFFGIEFNAEEFQTVTDFFSKLDRVFERRVAHGRASHRP